MNCLIDSKPEGFLWRGSTVGASISEGICAEIRAPGEGRPRCFRGWSIEVLDGINRCCWASRYREILSTRVSVFFRHNRDHFASTLIFIHLLTWQTPSKWKKRCTLQRKPAAERLHHPQHRRGRGNSHLRRLAPPSLSKYLLSRSIIDLLDQLAAYTLRVFRRSRDQSHAKQQRPALQA